MKNTIIFAVAFMVMSIPALTHAAVLNRQLDLGMTGTDVSAVQTYLAKDITIYPQGLVTGYFGSLTSAAVSNFQAANGLERAGRVGPLTLILLNNRMGDNTAVNNSSSAPYIGPVSVSTSNTSVVLNWNTNEFASATVYYSTSPLSMTESSATSGVVIGGAAYVVHSDLRSTHSATLSGLQSNTTYYYIVYNRDGLGNESISWPSTFTTTN